jgi:hypothetical protein
MAGFVIIETIRVPADAVYEFAASVDRFPRWRKGAVSAEALPIGPLQPGSQVREVQRLGQRETVIEWEVMQASGPQARPAPPYNLVLRCHFAGSEATLEYSFAADSAGGTLASLTCRVQAHRACKRLVQFVAARILSKELGDHLLRLKAAIEAAGPRAGR